MLLRVEALHQLLQHLREDHLVEEVAGGVLLPIGPQLLAPVSLHGREQADIEGLHLVGAVGREANKLDVMFPAEVNDLNGDVGGEINSQQDLLPRQVRR